MHPDSVSIPMTCAGGIDRQKDVVFNVLFTGDRDWILRMNLRMIASLHRATGSSHLQHLQEALSQEQAGISLLRVVWVLLMNVCMDMKEIIVNPGNTGALQRLSLADDPHSGTPLSCLVPMEAPKARRLFVDLHGECAPQWLQNQALGIDRFLCDVKALYLNS